MPAWKSSKSDTQSDAGMCQSKWYVCKILFYIQASFWPCRRGRVHKLTLSDRQSYGLLSSVCPLSFCWGSWQSRSSLLFYDIHTSTKPTCTKLTDIHMITKNYNNITFPYKFWKNQTHTAHTYVLFLLYVSSNSKILLKSFWINIKLVYHPDSTLNQLSLLSGSGLKYTFNASSKIPQWHLHGFVRRWHCFTRAYMNMLL